MFEWINRHLGQEKLARQFIAMQLYLIEMVVSLLHFAFNVSYKTVQQ